jgi:hypothetical protein
MSSQQYEKFNRFDQVQIRTSRNVKYLSALPGTNISPKGVWSVIGVVADSELMITKDNVIVRIPCSDVLKVADYNLFDIESTLGRLLDHGQRRREEGQKESSGDEH